MKRLITLAALGLVTLTATAQTPDSSATKLKSGEAELEKLRTESGVDPTRVTSRASYSVMYYAMSNDRAQINNRAALSLGVNRWSFTLKPEVVSITNPAFGSGFRTGFGDIKFTALNAFYATSKLAIAGSVEFGLPTGGSDFGSGYFSLTPALTLSYTVSPSLFLAVQPQYTFSLAKDSRYPDLNTFSARIFAAWFLKSGFFFVLEPRPIVDLNTGQFSMIISPLVGKSLGGGFNLILLSEIPITEPLYNNRGVMIQLGVSKSF